MNGERKSGKLEIRRKIRGAPLWSTNENLPGTFVFYPRHVDTFQPLSENWPSICQTVTAYSFPKRTIYILYHDSPHTAPRLYICHSSKFISLLNFLISITLIVMFYLYVYDETFYQGCEENAINILVSSGNSLRLLQAQIQVHCKFIFIPTLWISSYE